MSIFELRDRVLALPALEKRMDLLRAEIRKAENDVSGMLRQYERESRDVEHIRKDSLSSFLLRLAGKYEDRLEKEQREEIGAKIAYDRAAARFESLVRDRGDLAARISSLKADERAYKAELENRRRELSGRLSEPNGIRYAELESERNDIIAQMAALEEALRAASRAMSTAGRIAKSLDSAEGWATFDAFARGGIISHMAKYSHIDDAEENFGALSRDLGALKSELGDVQGLAAPGLDEISAGQRAVDFWFDNIFTDLSVRSQINGNAEQISRLTKNIGRAEAALKAKYREKETELARNRQSEDELLLSMP